MTSKLSHDCNPSGPAYGPCFVARNRGDRIATVYRRLTPNPAVNTDAPSAALRARGGSPVTLVR